MDVDAAFILKFIIIGFKVTDLGNIVRIANDSIVESMISLPDVEIELLRNLIKSGTDIPLHFYFFDNIGTRSSLDLVYVSIPQSKGVRSNELGILLASNISVDEINAAASGSTGIMELIKSTDKSDKPPVTVPEYGTKPVKLIHPRYNSLNTFYPVTNNLQFIQSGNNLQIMVPAKSISPTEAPESTSEAKLSGFISIARVPDTMISWKQDVRPLLSNALAIKAEGVNFNRKGRYFFVYNFQQSPGMNF